MSTQIILPSLQHTYIRKLVVLKGAASTGEISPATNAANNFADPGAIDNSKC